MNARQKAKKYKQELERLKRQAVQPHYIYREPADIVTVRAVYIEPDTTTVVPLNVVRSELDRLISRSDTFRQAITYDVGWDYLGNRKYTASIDIVMK